MATAVHWRQCGRCRFRQGFTLVELLVVIGIIALLISILLPSLGRARDQAKITQCLSNMRELTKAWMVYADVNKGYVTPATTGPGKWVDNGDTIPAIQTGVLYPYIQNVDVYKCGADNLDRYRSYSMNDFWNGDRGGYQHVKKLTQVRNTTDVFVFIEETDFRGYNQGSFVVDPYPSWRWVDYPAQWHLRGTTFSFADGHAEHWRWEDSRTWALQTNYVDTPNNSDIRKLQRVLGFSPPP